jgi:hypothetical protein
MDHCRRTLDFARHDRVGHPGHGRVFDLTPTAARFFRVQRRPTFDATPSTTIRNEGPFDVARQRYGERA